jgi:PleD family two-component response regulator
MCYLCLQSNPFAIPEDHSILSVQKKKARAALVKELLKELETYKACEDGKKEVEALKEEQYKLSREI